MYIEVLKQDICSVVGYFILLDSGCTLLLKYTMCVLERSQCMLKKERPVVTMYVEGEYKRRQLSNEMQKIISESQFR
jgi:hypothetical protein